MPNWLTKATGRAPGESRDAPQTFQLTCECSEQHTGQRKGRPQRIICQTCGAALFVLPKNAYPALKDRSVTGKRRRKQRAGGPPTGPGLPSANELARTVRSGIVGAASGVGRGAGAATAAIGQWLAHSAASLLQEMRSLLTPFRLVVMAMAVILIATAVVTLRSRAIESARTTLRMALESGQAALAEKDFVAARDHFASAAAAAATLGSHDAQSQLAQQLHRETLAITQLAPESLFAMVDEAETPRPRIGSVTWQDIFNVRYAGTWLVLHAPIQRVEAGYVVALPLRVGDAQRSVTIRADLPIFEQLPSTDAATPVLFAAPIAACELSAAGDEWQVTLDPQKGFLWSTLDNLQPLGLLEDEWTDPEELAALLEAQTTLMGGGT